MNQDYWWENEPKDRTQEAFEYYSQQIREYLDSEGIKGYLLGEPTLYEYTTMQICVLDPQDDVYKNVLLFATHVTRLGNPNSEIKPLGKDNFHFNYDKRLHDYEIAFETQGVDNKMQEFTGRFNREAQITKLQEV